MTAAAPLLLAIVTASLGIGSAHAQTVSMGGSLGSRALLVIDGKAKNVAVNDTVDGVRLISVTGNEAVVEVKGKRLAVQLGGAPANLGGMASEGGGKQIVLVAESGGHFVTPGTINGRSVRFVVDTGATTIALSQAEADRIGLDYKNGARGLTHTANGAVAMHRVKIGAVRIGDVVVYDVEATVLPAPLPFVLLGNSYLSRFQMRRDNDRMTLDKRF